MSYVTDAPQQRLLLCVSDFFERGDLGDAERREPSFSAVAPHVPSRTFFTDLTP